MRGIGGGQEWDTAGGVEGLHGGGGWVHRVGNTEETWGAQTPVGQLSPHPGLPSPGGRGVAVGPILSDSASDIFCGNENSPNFLFHNRGDGTYRDVAAAVGE